MSTRDHQAEWHAQMNERHAKQVVAGKHDSECEYRSNGHFLCNCKGRKRVAEGFTIPPGELIQSNPTCPRCYAEVGFDGDSFVCEFCRVKWGTSFGAEAEFIDSIEPLDIAEWDERHAEKEANK